VAELIDVAPAHRFDEVKRWHYLRAHIGQWEGIHWPGLDEEISLEALLAGGYLPKSAALLKRWLTSRNGSEND
jgi:hypothetical protein